ncbi:MAG: phosphotransferase [Oscillochloridaceae bacterium]|nr:aminoglycoside phosphotransferase family protein [Chloroflexaceae bacterium]MDW8391817.1 phosphotransferase [Oscillochloridaceae bacterium]
MDYTHLNHAIPPVSEGMSDAWRRLLAHLGEHTALIVRALNLRPTAVTLYGQTEQHILVRISTLNEHLILRIAPEDDLAAHVFFLRMMSAQNLPAARLIQRDLSCTLAPFAYTLETFAPGVPATALDEPHLLRGAGRQAGRVLRRMHHVNTPGAGRPRITGRWPQMHWRMVLRRIGEHLAPPPADALLFSEAERAAIGLLLDDERLELPRPVLMHGAFSPAVVRCTAGNGVHLEAIEAPGRWVGGDGLWDLACGLCPVYPEPWREGLLEGYNVAGPLSPAEEERLPLLRLLASFWLASYHYMRAQPYEAARDDALRLIETLVAA